MKLKGLVLFTMGTIIGSVTTASYIYGKAYYKTKKAEVKEKKASKPEEPKEEKKEENPTVEESSSISSLYSKEDKPEPTMYNQVYSQKSKPAPEPQKTEPQGDIYEIEEWEYELEEETDEIVIYADDVMTIGATCEYIQTEDKERYLPQSIKTDLENNGKGYLYVKNDRNGVAYLVSKEARTYDEFCNDNPYIKRW